MLDGLVQKRRQIVDQIVRQADPAKKRERQMSGLLQRAIIDAARPPVPAGFQADDIGKVNIRKSSLT